MLLDLVVHFCGKLSLLDGICFGDVAHIFDNADANADDCCW